ncbi:MAG: hypothetical protein Q9183_002748 [Haloplaca sp. 2 TL-2023]
MIPDPTADEVPKDALQKEQGSLSDLLNRKQLWKFASSADSSVRRAIYRLLQTSMEKEVEVQNLEAISSGALVSGLSLNQATSALDYAKALASITQSYPTLWTDHYTGTGKKTAAKRLCQFLAKGSQGAPNQYWDEINTVLDYIPISVLLPEGDPSQDNFAVVEALRDGATTRDEPRTNQLAVWTAYTNLVKRLLTHPNIERTRLIETAIIPIIKQYIAPSRETSPWTISASQQQICLNALQITLTFPQMFIDMWRALSATMIQDVQTSSPEQSKDFCKSQDAVSSKASRLYNLQLAVNGFEFTREIREAILETSASEIESASAVLEARKGKPYGAASLIVTAIGSLPMLSTNERIKNALIEMITKQDGERLCSPAGPYMIELLPFLKDILDVDACYRRFLEAVLQVRDGPAKEKALEKLVASPCLACVARDQQVLLFLTSEIRRFVTSESEDSRLLGTVITNPDAPSELSQGILAHMFDDLSLDQSRPASLRGLQLVAKHNKDAIRVFEASSNGSALLSKVMSLAESSDGTTSLMAKNLSEMLQDNSSADPSHDSQKLLGIIRQGLDTIEAGTLSIASLLDLAKKTLQKCQEQDRAAVATEVLPTEVQWNEALQPVITSRPNASLAITNPLGNTIYLVDQPLKTESAAYDEDGHSKAFRLFWYTSVLLSATDVLEHSTLERTSCTIKFLALVSQIANDHLSVRSSCSLWEVDSIESEEDIIDIIGDTQRLVASWLASHTLLDVVTDKVLPALLEDSRGRGTRAYYSSRAYTSLMSELIELHTDPDTGSRSDEIKQTAKTSDVFRAVAVLSTIQDVAALTRLFNELLADTTGNDLSNTSNGNGVQDMVLLSSILDREDFLDILPSIPKQRLVFFVQHVCKHLVSLIGRDTSSETRSLPTGVELVQISNIMRVLRHFLSVLGETYGSFWEETVDVLGNMWTADKEFSDEHLPLVHASLRMHATLLKLGTRETNDDLLDALRDREKSLGNGLVGLLYALQGAPDESHQPRAIVHELLARQVTKTGGSIDTNPDGDLYAVLASQSSALQGAAYELLHRSIPKSQENVSLDKALSKDYRAKLPEELLSLILEVPTMEGLVDASFKRSMPAFLQTYLLSWHLIFDHWDGASEAVKNDYLEALKQTSDVNGLLNLASDFLITSRTRPIDASKFEVDSYDSKREDLPEKKAQWLLIHLYYLALKHLPTLSKSWWRDHTSRQTQISVEDWTVKYVSPFIISTELATVSSWAPSVAAETEHPITVKTSTSTREITASIPIDEQTMSLAITLPPSYPLARATVSGLHRVGVREQQWRSWIITSQGVINFSQVGGGNQLIDGLMAWRKNVTATLKGQKECAICYSVIVQVTDVGSVSA